MNSDRWYFKFLGNEVAMIDTRRGHLLLFALLCMNAAKSEQSGLISMGKEK